MCKDSCVRSFKRPCPKCGSACRVIKSMVVSSNHLSAVRMQNIACTFCGLRGLVTLTEEIEWANLTKYGEDVKR